MPTKAQKGKVNKATTRKPDTWVLEPTKARKPDTWVLEIEALIDTWGKTLSDDDYFEALDQMVDRAQAAHAARREDIDNG